jgi:hypothetical protein
VRISTKGTVASVAAIGLLVVGVDYATFAATGDSLLLGQVNKTDNSTAIKRSDRGPALRLTTKSTSDAPLSTNGTGKVVHLNADRVDGKHAKTLATHAITYKAGEVGQTVSPAGLWSTHVKPGLYEISFNALLWDQTGPSPANFICGVLDLNTFGTANQTIYTADSAAYFGGTNGGPPAAVSGSATVRIHDGATPGGVCFPEAGTFEFFKPLRVTFTKINSRDIRTARSAPFPMGAKESHLFSW